MKKIFFSARIKNIESINNVWCSFPGWLTQKNKRIHQTIYCMLENVLEEIGYTPISRAQANCFFTFINDTYEITSIFFTTNKKITEWAEMMGNPVLTTTMMDRILHHASSFFVQGRVLSTDKYTVFKVPTDGLPYHYLTEEKSPYC